MGGPARNGGGWETASTNECSTACRMEERGSPRSSINKKDTTPYIAAVELRHVVVQQHGVRVDVGLAAHADERVKVLHQIGSVVEAQRGAAAREKQAGVQRAVHHAVVRQRHEQPAQGAPTGT